jgi:D-3-phosphoglycerate dehydrogenase
MGNVRVVSTLAELLQTSDFVTLHVPATPQTHELIGSAELALMKPKSYLLNASRGTVVVIDALAEALRSGHLAGAAVDVYPEEPEGNSDGFVSALQNLPNVILTPHVGGSTVEAQAAIGREVAGTLIKFLKQGSTAGAVNFPQAEIPLADGAHRLLNVHRNQPGVLRDVSRIVADRQANIMSQVLATDASIGYLIMDLEQEVAEDVRRDIAALPTSIRTRILMG